VLCCRNADLLTLDGAKPIESLEIGQVVWSHDQHKGLVARAVTALHRHRCRVTGRIVSAGAWRVAPIELQIEEAHEPTP
jgi:hypothetical protein